MDIGTKKPYPASALSNFAPHPFEFDGVYCASMEGLLQSFKFDKHHIQLEVCKMTGLAAKRRGQKRNKAWKQKQTLWWMNTEYPRYSEEYQNLLDRAFSALSENDGFAKALLATNTAHLTHSIGRSKKNETVLTEQEFCSRLMKIRDVLNRNL